MPTAPASVRDNCRAGLARRIRCACGGTAAAVRFAEMVLAGHDFTEFQLTTVALAHTRLDSRLISAGVPTEETTVEQLLWGGNQAAEWARGVLDTRPPPAPEPVHAALTPVRAGPLDDLNVRLLAIDGALSIKVATILESFLTAALQAAGMASANAVLGPKAPKAIKAALTELLGPVEYDRLRSSVAAANPAGRPSLLPPSIRAQVTERERAVVGRALEPMAATLAAAIEAAQIEAALAVSDVTGEALPADVAGRAGSDRDDAVAFAVAALFALALLRLDSPDLVPDENGITEGFVPDDLVRSTIGIAGGLPRDADGIVRDADDALVDVAGRPRPTGVALSSNTVAQLDVALADPVVRQAMGVAALTTLRVIHTWRSTKREFPPHAALEGVQWRDETERRTVCAANPGEWPYVSVFRPNPSPDHKGCGCYVESGLILELP